MLVYPDYQAKGELPGTTTVLGPSLGGSVDCLSIDPLSLNLEVLVRSEP